MNLSLYQRHIFLGRGLCSGSSTLARVPEKCPLEGEGYDTLNGCLGEGKPPSCLRATARNRNEVEGQEGAGAERQRSIMSLGSS
jgi:hypothetical protein